MKQSAWLGAMHGSKITLASDHAFIRILAGNMLCWPQGAMTAWQRSSKVASHGVKRARWILAWLVRVSRHMFDQSARSARCVGSMRVDKSAKPAVFLDRSTQRVPGQGVA